MNDFRVASVQGTLSRRGLYFFGFLAYLAVLPIANTVALRYLLLQGLLGLIAFELMLKKTLPAHSWRVLPLVPGGLLLLWAVYLLLFPLWAAQPIVAWENLRGQWGTALLAWIIGIAGVLLLLHAEDPLCEEYIPSKLYEDLWMQRLILSIVHRNPQMAAMIRGERHTVVEPGRQAGYSEHHAVAQPLSVELERLYERWRSVGLPDSGRESPYTTQASSAQLVGWARGLPARSYLINPLA